MNYDLGYIDLEQRTLQTIDNPFGAMLQPMSPVQTVINVSGSDPGKLAEGVGFEPTIRLITVYTLSRRAPSTTRPSLPREANGVPRVLPLGVVFRLLQRGFARCLYTK